MRRAPKGEGGGASWGVWGMLPQKMFIFRASEMPFPIFSRKKFYKSMHEKTLTIQ